MEKNAALKISIIGSGRLGSTLAYAIDNENSQEASVVSVSSRTDKTLIAAKELLSNSSKKIFFTHNNLRAAKISNCIFICTPDDEIEKTCHEIFKENETASGEEAKNVFSDQARSSIKSSNNIKCLAETTVIHFSG